VPDRGEFQAREAHLFGDKGKWFCSDLFSVCWVFFWVVRPHFQPTTFCLLMSWFQGLVDRAEDRRDPELQSLTVPCVHEMCFVNSLLYDLGCKVIVSILQNQLPYTSLQKSSNHFSVCGARLEENFFGVFAISIWVRL